MHLTKGSTIHVIWFICVLTAIRVFYLGFQYEESLHTKVVEKGSVTEAKTQPQNTWRNGVVAADQPDCSEMGAEVLRKGGNAIDASVTTALCLGLLNPFASGIGGGGFMLISLSNGTKIVIDYREMAPKDSCATLYADGIYESVQSGRAVAIPLELKGLRKAFDLFGSGRISWSELVMPVAKLAQEGFVITQLFEDRLKENESMIRKWAKIASLYTKDGTLLKTGDVITRTDLSDLFKKIAKDGVAGFYEGEVADDIVKTISNNGGNMTYEDLECAAPSIRKPLHSKYRGYNIYGAPPPSSGGVSIAFMLSVLDQIPLKKLGWNAKTAHKIVEILKFSFAQRGKLGDPAFIPDVKSTVEKLLNQKFHEAILSKIDDTKTHEPKYYLFDDAQIANDHGTAHFSIIDKERNAVSCTTTVNLSFGSKLMTEKYGILLNNQMDDFSVKNDNSFGIPFSVTNKIEPRKRPLSSMAPTIITNDRDELWMSIGASGGPRIISALLSSIINVVDFGLPLEDTIHSPRFHHQWIPNKLLVESHFPSDIKKELELKGHIIDIADYLPDGHVLGNVQIVMRRDDDFLEAASDYRKHGCPHGY